MIKIINITCLIDIYLIYLIYLSTINVINSINSVNSITVSIIKLHQKIKTKTHIMKNLTYLLLLIVSAGFMFVSCEGPAGPAGPAGADGTNGTNGIDANASCTLCHDNSALIETKYAQWSNSIHATGENAAYANRAGCVQCHTSQGFLEFVAEGSAASISVPTEPQQINCYTCHQIHKTWTDEDWALTKPAAEPLILKYAGETVTYNLGNSNQCVACHQARDVNPAPVIDGPDFEITNTRIGVHHGPQSTFLLGKIPFEIAGTAYPTSNPHGVGEGCVTCHMATPYGYKAGGHTWNMTYSAHGGPEKLNNTGCMTCHPSAKLLLPTSRIFRQQWQPNLNHLKLSLLLREFMTLPQNLPIKELSMPMQFWHISITMQFYRIKAWVFIIRDTLLLCWITQLLR